MIPRFSSRRKRAVTPESPRRPVTFAQRLPVIRPRPGGAVGSSFRRRLASGKLPRPTAELPMSPLHRSRISRRECLRVGGLGIAGLSLPTLLRAEARAARAQQHPARAKSCIIVWLAGGPSQPDMWDMKPDAPAEIRGEFKAVKTTVPGVLMCEHLPRVARQAHHTTIIRSAHHQVGHAHCAAAYFVLSGDNRGDTFVNFGASPNDHPGIGAVLARLRPPEKLIAPYVTAPYVMTEGIGGPPSPGIYGGWMGHAFDPFEVNRHRSETEDPNSPKFGFPDLTLRAEVDPARMDGRRALLARVDGRRQSSSSARTMD